MLSLNFTRPGPRGAPPLPRSGAHPDGDRQQKPHPRTARPAPVQYRCDRSPQCGRTERPVASPASPRCSISTARSPARIPTRPPPKPNSRAGIVRTIRQTSARDRVAAFEQRLGDRFNARPVPARISCPVLKAQGSGDNRIRSDVEDSEHRSPKQAGKWHLSGTGDG